MPSWIVLRNDNVSLNDYVDRWSWLDKHRGMHELSGVWWIFVLIICRELLDIYRK